jgi:hypothetical protein
MKKYIQFFVVLALVLTIVGIARTNPAWAGALTNPAKANPFTGVDLLGLNSAQPMSIVVTGSGSYLIGGVCQFNTTYKATDLKDAVDAEVPIAESSKVPFNGEGDLYFPGCHIVHYKAEQVVKEASTADGDWQVCFGKRPDIQMKIYYYVDDPVSGRVWIELPTTNESAYACAPALQTGVYMPAGIVVPLPGGGSGIPTPATPTPGPGSVQPPPFNNVITQSGTYAVGGICMLEVFYKVENLSDFFVEEFPVQDNLIVTFPENNDLLFFPGCHVLHYEQAVVQKLMGPEKGEWMICFAAHPDKKMTIYFYDSMVHLDMIENIAPPWIALPTTTENGLACAPAHNTGVYVPAGQ